MSDREENDLQEEAKETYEATEGPETTELSDQDLEEVAGGACQCQITD